MEKQTAVPAQQAQQTPEQAQPAAGANGTAAPGVNAGMVQFGKEQLAALKQAWGVQYESLAQLAQDEGGDRVLALWKAGASLPDAWAVVNLEKVISKKTAALKQAALNAVRSKQHLTPAGGTAAETPPPQEVYEQYRALVPGMTDQQISADWNRYRSR